MRPTNAAVELLEGRCLFSGSVNNIYAFPVLIAPPDPGSIENPIGALTVDQGTVYGYCGVQPQSGDIGIGIYAMAPSSSTPTVLATFDPSGANGNIRTEVDVPGGLVLDNGSLYGAAPAGGPDGDGVIFKLDLTTKTITNLDSFNGTNGATPHGGLTLVGSTLYGVTEAGGTNGDGTIFSIPVAGGSITTVASFNGTNGTSPDSTLAADALGNLYGTTKSGGSDLTNKGVIFELAAGQSTIMPLASLSAITPPVQFVQGPNFSLVVDLLSGNLYGDAFEGMFELVKNTGVISMLTTPQPGSDESWGGNSIARDSTGDLFATWSVEMGLGEEVYELPANSSTPVSLGRDGNPGPITLDDDGNLYGIAYSPHFSEPSNLFEVANAAPIDVATKLVFARTGTITANGVPISPAPTVYLEDANGNLVTTDNSIVTLTITNPNGLQFVDGPFTATAINGVATFPDVTTTSDTFFSFGQNLHATDGLLAATNAQLGVNFPGNPGAQGTGSLAPVSATSTLPQLLITGTKLNGVITASIVNASQQTSKGKDQISVYASINGSIDSSSILLGTVFRHLTLKAGEKAKVAVPIKNIALPKGTFGIVVQATDPSGTTRSVVTGSIDVGAPFLSLGGSVGAVTPTLVRVGRTGQFKLTMTGLGNMVSTGPATIAIGLSIDGNTIAIPLTTVTRAVKVKAGKSVLLTLHFKLPKNSQAAGTYFPIVTYTQGQSSLTIPGSVAFTVVNPNLAGV